MEKTQSIRSLLTYLFVICVDNFGFSIVFIMFAPLFLDPAFQMIAADTSAASKNILLGLSFAAFPFCQLFGGPILGDLADFLGRKKALYISTLGISLGFILSAISIALHSVFLLIISRLFSGFFAGNVSISFAGIADLSTSEKERGRNLGYAAAVMGASWILAMVFSGFLNNKSMVGIYGPEIVFWVTAFLSFINFLTVILFLQETHTVTTQPTKINILAGIKNISFAFRIPDLKKLYFVYFLWIIGWGSGAQWMQAYTMKHFETPPNAFVIFMIIFGLAWSLGSSVINTWLLKLFPSQILALIGMFVIATGVFIEGFMPSFFWLGLGLTVSSIFAAFTMSNMLNIISLKATEDIQGRVMGLGQSVQASGWIVGSILVTIIFSISSAILYPFLGILLFFGAILLLTVHNSQNLHENY